MGVSEEQRTRAERVVDKGTPVRVEQTAALGTGYDEADVPGQ